MVSGTLGAPLVHPPFAVALSYLLSYLKTTVLKTYPVNMQLTSNYIRLHQSILPQQILITCDDLIDVRSFCMYW